MRYVPGFRTYLPPLIQWQPTTTSHDPNPPITIDGAPTLSASADQPFSIGQTATGAVGIAASAAQGFTLGQTATSTVPAVGSVGGWDQADIDPYYYRKKPKKKEDVHTFLHEVLGWNLPEAPKPIQAQAQLAKASAQAYVAKVDRGEALRELKIALGSIDHLYEMLRQEAQRQQDEDDEDWLLLAA